jgi:hypothetical protein
MNLRVWIANMASSNQFGTTSKGSIVVVFTSSCSLKKTMV